MRLAIDAREIQDGVRTGIGRALYNFLRYFDALNTEDLCILIVEKATPLVFSSRIAVHVIPTARTQYWDQVLLPGALGDIVPDLFYSPYYKLPLVYRGRKVCAVLDLMYLTYPPYRQKLGLAQQTYYATVGRAMVQSADAVLTCSGYSASEVHEVYGIAEEKIRVIPLSVGSEYHSECRDTAKRTRTIQSFTATPYLLYVGNFKPHKNTPLLLDVLEGVSDLRPDLGLLLAGPDGAEAQDLLAKAQLRGLAGRVRVTGAITDGNILRQLYQGAELFVMPSCYEGFGIPPLEAMACGCPVVSSNATSLPEVVGKAGLTVDPGSSELFVRAVRRVLTDRFLRDDLVRFGLTRAEFFREDRVGPQMYAFFKELSGT